MNEFLLESIRELNKLDELAQYKRINGDNHFTKHIENKDGKDDVLLRQTTREEYADGAEELSSSPAIYLKRNYSDVIGYIDQRGRKVKVKRIGNSSNCEFVVYVGDDITGEVITYFVKSWAQFIAQANPYTAGSKLHKYKSDLDGKFNGLDMFIPKPSMTENEYHQIRNKIINGERL